MSDKKKTTKQEQPSSKESMIGCGVVLVILFLIIAGCNAVFGDDDKESEEKPTTTQSQEAEPAVTDEQVEEWAKGVLGGGADDSWSQIAAKEYSPAWAYAVNRVYYGKGGNVVFNMQLNRDTDKPTAEEIGKLYANAIRLTPPDWASGVSYVVVEDGTGTHIHQTHVER